MKILLTGATGYVGGVLAPRLLRDGHELRGLTRNPQRSGTSEYELVRGDAISGDGLAAALDDIEVAYFLIHSMEPSSDGPFAARELRAAENFSAAARAAGVRRVVYLGGPMPQSGRVSAHLASRLAVERVLLKATPDSVALRASVVIGAGSSSFRFLVRLVERLPILPLPPWRHNRGAPIDERDAVALLASAADSDQVGGQSLDIRGRDIVSYGELVDRISDLMLVGRPLIGIPLTVTPIASRIAALIAGERHELIGPLMESLDEELLPRDDRAAQLLGVRLHSLDAAIEHALREWESVRPLAAR